MKSYFAYIRVSTTRQGEEGVSLQEQRRAILEYAAKRGITVDTWFEEQVSAAKRGRPVFTKLLGLLKSKKSTGLIIHKIDRGARNLRDWADMAELMDRGVEVHFAHESIDLHTRSGRLSADILAVVAADYIRNLREETIKGINGRLRQGIFPFAAPVGYLDNGGGKAKTVDPVRGPLIRQAFELYASRRYSLQELEDELFRRGMRTKTGKRFMMSHLSLVLRNPFYMGLIRLRNRNETYAGIHEPLITSSVYNQVQLMLDGKRSFLRYHNQFLFRLAIKCEHCKLYVIGDRKKGHVYYRCLRRMCPTTCIREERFEEAVIEVLKKLTISAEEETILADVLSEFKMRETEITLRLRRDVEADLEHIQQSTQTLLQKYLDNAVSKETFDEGHTALLMNRRAYEEKLWRLSPEQSIHRQTERFLGNFRSVCERFLTGRNDERRAIVDQVFASITTSGKMIHLALHPLMQLIAMREKTRDSWQRLLPPIAREIVENGGSSETERSVFTSKIELPKCGSTERCRNEILPLVASLPRASHTSNLGPIVAHSDKVKRR